MKLETFTKLKKENSVAVSAFGYKNREKYPIFVSNNAFKKSFSFITARRKRKQVLFSYQRLAFMHDHALHYGRKHFCRYFLQAFSIEEILKCHIKDCFKVNDEQRIKLPKRVEYVKIENFERNIKSPLMVYADFKSIQVSEDNGK